MTVERKTNLAVYVLLILTTSTMFWRLFQQPALYAEAYKAGYEAGYKAGSKQVDYKQMALQDQNYSRKLCTAWWFDSSIKDRKLK